MALRPRRVISGALALVTVTTSALVFGHDAQAFKPYTHIQTGYDAYADAIDDGIGHDRHGEDVPGRPLGVVDGAAAVSVVLQRRRDRSRRLPRPGDGPVGGAPRGHRPVADVPARRGVGRAGARRRPGRWRAVHRGREAADPGVHLRLHDPRGRRHVGAHARSTSCRRASSPASARSSTDADMAAIALRHLLVEGYVGAATTGLRQRPQRGGAHRAAT